MIPPIKPEPPLTASIPPIRPGVRPGRSAMEKAIKPASTGTISAKAEPPPICISAAASGVFHFKRFDPRRQRRARYTGPGHYHRQHIGDAGQQVAIGARRLFFPFSSRLRFAGWLVRFGFRHRFIQLLGRFSSAPDRWWCGTSACRRISPVHLDIGSDDHQIRLGHLFRGDGIARPNGAAGLHLHPPAAFLASVSMASAAIKVWATPVGQAVTATMRFCP